MGYFYSDSKTDLELLRECCIKLQLFEGVQDVFSRLTAVCYVSLFPIPTERPSTTTDTSVGPPVALNIEFCVLVLSEQYELQFATKILSGQQSELVS